MEEMVRLMGERENTMQEGEVKPLRKANSALMMDN